MGVKGQRGQRASIEPAKGKVFRFCRKFKIICGMIQVFSTCDEHVNV